MKSDVRQSGITVIEVLHSPTTTKGRIAAERHIHQARTAVIFVAYSAAFHRRVVLEDHIYQIGAAPVRITVFSTVIHPTAKGGIVATKDHIVKTRVALVVIHAAAPIIRGR